MWSAATSMRGARVRAEARRPDHQRARRGAAAVVATDSVTLAVVKSIQTSASPARGQAADDATPAALDARAAGRRPCRRRRAPGRSVAAASSARGVAGEHGADQRAPHPPVGAQDGDRGRGIPYSATPSSRPSSSSCARSLARYGSARAGRAAAGSPRSSAPSSPARPSTGIGFASTNSPSPSGSSR